MGEIRQWGQFAEQDVREIRQRYLRERIQVSREGHGMHAPGLSIVSPTSGIAAEWFRSLTKKQQLVVRGVAAAKDSRKSALSVSFAGEL